MNNQKQIKKYANSFISTLKSNLKSGYETSVLVHPADGKGAILEFLISKSEKENIAFTSSVSTINKILENIEQKFIGGNIAGVTFSGTNVYMDGNRIVIIKGDNDHESWSNSAADADVWRVLTPTGNNK